MMLPTRHVRSLTFIAGLVGLLGTTVACGDEAPSGAPESTATPTSTCPAATLTPTYLPGVTAVKQEPLVGEPEYTKTWKSENSLVQLVGGISADRGDDPGARSVKVRGFDGQVGPVPIDGSDYLIVDWSEDEECGSHQYAVISQDVGEEGLLRIANSLVEEPLVFTPLDDN